MITSTIVEQEANDCVPR